MSVKKKGAELQKIQNLIDNAHELLEFELLETVNYEEKEYPIWSMSIGSKRDNVPVFGLFGGVHGLERVGSQVILSWFRSLNERLHWDVELQKSFENIRIVSIPIVNPYGVYHLKRSNGNGVDLMRNSPVEAKGTTMPLVGGHRISRYIPWYRGRAGSDMEIESQVLIKYCKDQFFNSPFAMTIDFHSGFGLKDRLWYPFAKSNEEFPKISYIKNMEKLFNNSLPYHIYTIEPQSNHYTTHGDLWDYIYEEFESQKSSNTFIPWTLEMGSWIWLKKNPWQIFSSQGLFNPMKRHRYERTMRRHYALIDYFSALSSNYKSWVI